MTGDEFRNYAAIAARDGMMIDAARKAARDMLMLPGEVPSNVAQDRIYALAAVIYEAAKRHIEAA